MIGAAVGGLVGLVGTILAQLLTRAATIAERSREERRAASAAFLTSAEDCLHHFERLAEGYVSTADFDPERRKAQFEEDRKRAHYFYDENVTGRLRVMEIIGDDDVIEAAADLRRVLNDIDDMMMKPTIPTEAEFKEFVRFSYRPARRAFTRRARTDLDEQRGRWRRKLVQSGE